MPDDLARAFEFMARADMAGTGSARWRFGTAVFSVELPLRHDSNYLLAGALGPTVAAEELIAQADAARRPDGTHYPVVLIPREDAAARLAPEMQERGWQVQRFLVMAHRRPSDREPGDADVREVGEADLRPLRESFILAQPWGSPELARQLLAAKAVIASKVDTRFLAAFVDGEVASQTDLYLDPPIAQIEDVGTVERHRNRGLASAVVLRALADAREAGCDFVFLVADDEDWPKEWYGKLGFDPIGRYVKFRRPAS